MPLMQPPAGHDWHESPPVPQAPSLVPGWQAPLAQQPDAHETPSHTQAPPMQCSPAPHGSAEPHWQLPFAEQLSAAMGSHAMQAAPPVPQLSCARAWQVPPEQHPFAQELASQVVPVSF
jgi:hypothetical protein